MEKTLAERVAECERKIIALKTNSETTADSSKLFRLFVELPAIADTQSNQKWIVELVPKDNRATTIVHPIFTTGAIMTDSPNSDSACCQYPDNKFKVLCRFRGSYYVTTEVLAPPMLTVYSNQELMVKSITTAQYS